MSSPKQYSRKAERATDGLVPHGLERLSRLVRAMPDLRRVRGGLPLVLKVLGPERFPLADEVLTDGDGLRFRLNRSSQIEWVVFHFGDYEGQEIRLFLDHVDGAPGVILDVGANIGNHALRFAEQSRTVYAFEPNPRMFIRLSANVALNPHLDVRPVNLALGRVAAKLPFFAPAEGVKGQNMGSGTFVSNFAPEVADVLMADIAPGDEVLDREGVGRVAAVKIDVQGFEPEVIQGLRNTLARDKPLIWFEASPDTVSAMGSAGGLAAVIPYEFRLFIFRTRSFLGLMHKVELAEVGVDGPLAPADYIVVPRGFGRQAA